jgi:YVTN family beta-propeller protein
VLFSGFMRGGTRRGVFRLGRRAMAVLVSAAMVFASLLVLGVSQAAAATADEMMYVTNGGVNTVLAYDTNTGTFSATIPAGSEPEGIAVNSADTNAYVANASAGTASVINIATNTVSATIPVSPDPYSVVISPSGSTVYVMSEYPGNVSVINTATNTVSATIPVAADAIDMAISPNGATLYVADDTGTAFTISVINTATNLNPSGLIDA